MRKRYTIEVENDQLSFFALTALKDTTLKKIAFGSKSIEVDFFPHPDEKYHCHQQGNSRSLYFPDFSIPLHTFIENQILFIGPLVGIFTAGFTPFPLRPIGERSNFFSKLLSVKKTVGALPFVFGEQHIDWEQGTMKGYFFQENNWKIIEIPFPNVIYDRLPNRKSERNPKLIKVKERLQKDYLIPWYNPGFFNKLDINERLLQDASVANISARNAPFYLLFGY